MGISAALNTAKNVVTSKSSLQLLKIKKNSPNLLFGVGVVGVVGTAVLASRATLQAEGILVDHSIEAKIVEKGLEEHGDKYSAKAAQRDMAVIYAGTVGSLVKAYAPAVIVGAASIACLAGSHNILVKRNASLTAAYVALDKGFKQYRARVVDELGLDKDREFRYGAEESDVKDDSGKVVAKKKTFEQESGASIYAKFFGPDNQNWGPRPEINLVFLRGQQSWANDRLRAKGYLLLNDVYDSLGIERTSEGCIVGWKLDNENGSDNYVDFGIWDIDACERMADFIQSPEGVILLDFNVDGVIYDQI